MTAQMQWQVARRPYGRALKQVGFENAPATLMRLFEGGNLGKQILKVA